MLTKHTTCMRGPSLSHVNGHLPHRPKLRLLAEACICLPQNAEGKEGTAEEQGRSGEASRLRTSCSQYALGTRPTYASDKNLPVHPVHFVAFVDTCVLGAVLCVCTDHDTPTFPQLASTSGTQPHNGRARHAVASLQSHREDCTGCTCAMVAAADQAAF